PPRRVFTVTKEGEAAFYRLLRENLSTYPTPEFPGAVGFDFVHMLPTEEVVALLDQRYQAVEAKFQQLDGVSAEIRQSHLAVEYLHHYYATELQWLDDVIARLKSSSQDHSHGEGHIHQGHGETGVLPHQVYSPEKRS
ncbi:MAG: hypothetical protein ACYTDV_17625, partial [Planctomycetota bacterium]